MEQTPLQELTAMRETSRSAGGLPEAFQECIRQSPLYLALVRTAAALADASKVQVRRVWSYLMYLMCQRGFGATQPDVLVLLSAHL